MTSNCTKHKHQNIFIKEKCIFWATFDPGLALSDFRTESSPDEKPVLGQKLTLKKCDLVKPAVRSRDTGQRIPCFDRCQLEIT